MQFSNKLILINILVGVFFVALVFPRSTFAQLVGDRTDNAINTFYYDAGGQRLGKVSSDAENTYYVSPSLEVVINTDGTMSYRRNYGFNGRVVAVREDSNVSYLHQDHLGSTSLVTNSSGNVTAQQVYYPYGETRTEDGNLPTEREYTGQVSDTDTTGLYYYNARYYNPVIGKFTQADTANDGLNKYAYVGNNPVNLNDPTGHRGGCPFWQWHCLIEAVQSDIEWIKETGNAVALAIGTDSDAFIESVATEVLPQAAVYGAAYMAGGPPLAEAADMALCMASGDPGLCAATAQAAGPNLNSLRDNVIDEIDLGLRDATLRNANMAVDDLVASGMDELEAITTVSNAVQPPFPRTAEELEQLSIAYQSTTLDDITTSPYAVCILHCEYTYNIAKARGHNTYLAGMGFETTDQRFSGHAFTIVDDPTKGLVVLDSTNNITTDTNHFYNLYAQQNKITRYRMYQRPPNGGGVGGFESINEVDLLKR